MQFEYCYIIPKEDELYHYGVKGMKWGVRRYQPYTSNPRKSGKSGKFVGKKKKNTTSKNVNKEGFIDPLTFHMIQLGLIIAPPLVAAGTAAVKRAMKTHGAKKINARIDANTKVDKKTGLKLKQKEMTPKEDLKMINPEKGSSKETGSTQNCARCTLAYEMRRRGYDVQAGKALNGLNSEKIYKSIFKDLKTQEVKGHGYSEMVKNKNGKSLITETFKKEEIKAMNGLNLKHWISVKNTMNKQPNSRGQMMVTWNRTGGHSFIYEVHDGKVTFMDGQTGKILSNADAKGYFSHATCSRFQRLDDKQIKNMTELKKYLK